MAKFRKRPVVIDAVRFEDSVDIFEKTYVEEGAYPTDHLSFGQALEYIKICMWCLALERCLGKKRLSRCSPLIGRLG